MIVDIIHTPACLQELYFLPSLLWILLLSSENTVHLNLLLSPGMLLWQRILFFNFLQNLTPPCEEWEFPLYCYYRENILPGL